jgi:hypothetical protein
MLGPPQVCAILRRGPTRADFEAAAAGLGFVHVETYPGDNDKVGYEQLWARPNATTPTAAVNYVESPLAGFHYLIVRGVDFPRTVVEFAGRLPLFTQDELLDEALHATAHDDQVLAINGLAIGFIEPDPVVVTVIRLYATEAANPLLREAAVNAMGFRAWPAFRPLLERIVGTDPAENVRQRAAKLLAHWPPAASG